MDTIFPVISIDRNEARWEDDMWSLTPVERRGDLFFKREDYFAPLGYGGINGSKLRQLIYLFTQNQDRNGVISASSVKSPQISMSALVAKHFGQTAYEIIGATRIDTALRHENVAIGARAGARFTINTVAYNPALQRASLALWDKHPGHWRLEYGISLPKDATPGEIRSFHSVGANQVMNVPDDIENIIIPTGSANSAISVLYGIYREKPKSLKNIYFMLIGPNKLPFMYERLQKIGAEVLPQLQETYNANVMDLHGEKYAEYQDEFNNVSYEGIDFHPTYEAKCFAYLQQYYPELLNPKTLFWIIGSKPYADKMEPWLSDMPQELPLL